jgi:hypothetical protein
MLFCLTNFVFIFFLMQMNPPGTYSFYRYRENYIRLQYSDERDSRFLTLFDITQAMFRAVKSPIVTDTYWKWVRGEAILTGSHIIWYEEDVYKIKSGVANHYIYLKKGREDAICDHVLLRELLRNVGRVIDYKIDVTSFGRLVQLESVASLPVWNP